MNLLTVFLMICFLSSAVSADDRMHLLEFKKSVSDPYGFLSSWNIDSSDHCSWFGVSCDSNRRVSGLRIGGNFSLAPSCSMISELSLHGFGIRRNCSKINGKLAGRLSPIVGNLTQLKVLSLPFNDLGGPIPIEIWGLKNLEVLDLEGNSLVGNISVFEFTSLKKLRILNLAFNMFFGGFPPSLSECRGLRILNFAGNDINDAVPRFFGRYKKLKVVNLSFNRLVGPVDAFGYDCGNLEHVDLSFNFLRGEIPRALGNCSRIRTILLSSNTFHGVIPRELGELQRLEVLDVSRNNLGGPLPATLGDCVDLSVLVLTNHFNDFPSKGLLRGKSPLLDSNYFEGSIPEEITEIQKLKIIWAPRANLGGDFPNDWGSCKSLKMVNLAQNLFTGEINGLFAGCRDLEYLNLSSNLLTGSLNASLLASCLMQFDISSNQFFKPFPHFNTDHIRCRLSSIRNEPVLPFENPSLAYFYFFSYKSRSEQALLPVPGPKPLILHAFSKKQNSSRNESRDDGDGLDEKLTILIPISVISASAVAGLVCVLIVFCFLRARRSRSRVDVSSSSPAVRYLTVFNDIGVHLTYDRIVQATGNFSRDHCIGSGGFGSTYRAEVAPGNFVAVKRRTADHQRPQGAPQFHAEIRILGRIRHPNLITLVGYFTSPAEMFLIYNYLPGGNLDRFIRNREYRPFNWAILHKISLHVASALYYLHDLCNPHVLHRDIKPSNILLDGDFNAYLADFGLSKFLATTRSHATTRVAGTYGYIAPEYAMTGRVSSKADVYSYGLVLLELMSDKRANDPLFYLQEDGYDIVTWAYSLRSRGLVEDVVTAKLWDAGPRDKLVKMLDLAIACSQYLASARPTMKQVVQRLTHLQPTPG